MNLNNENKNIISKQHHLSKLTSFPNTF